MNLVNLMVNASSWKIFLLLIVAPMFMNSDNSNYLLVVYFIFYLTWMNSVIVFYNQYFKRQFEKLVKISLLASSIFIGSISLNLFLTLPETNSVTVFNSITIPLLLVPIGTAIFLMKSENSSLNVIILFVAFWMIPAGIWYIQPKIKNETKQQ